ncbi:Uma2 family endonuclease [Planctomicrobium piriforme]|uniref:Endonuclease, Uma2 family (Restriction endonuclease fold) n=1 Tax=Planctomicrobium piriforme TaxID=1576369 RepID=A0A1I3AY49_9PLAN|nr:Uma2 family endonuclease [Planctomicrobium piriforme]SFH54973.1 Endonuclease, Uma2 family (restriction endonuclease fold) [Planctomicrobium piriforme]
MSIDAPPRNMTPEDFLLLPNRDAYELVNGELVELKMSEDSSWIAGEIFFYLRAALAKRRSGWIFPEGTMFRCFPADPNRVRRADASFIRNEHRPHGPESIGYTSVVPDLVVEVVSPGDGAYDVNEKVEDWLEAGVAVLWLVMPRDRTVTVYKAGQKPQLLTSSEEITLNLIPDFRCQVADFFPPTVEKPN